ncbi:penicillin-binding protein 1C [Aurantibacter aestuarii]|uniref:peptidoglycan glycosyltransferase n=1 Tax=Aurantibacter aestuarii TaxID=1266046 RepID=A0A2T1NDK1_9FLAO|nr:penicillin-binding protein 1C [Aurantibacter aestuarii]PSG90524.1 penicillin-binding protein 1C [Aurantibacter aestuarii]
MNKLKTYVFKHKIKAVVITVALIWYAFCLPKNLFNTPTSTVITSASNTLLGAKIAKDGQWRFPESDSIPQKFKTCVLYFEDEYFYKHPGFNPISIFKALKQNLASNEVKRGASTITQQVIRLSRDGQKRTYLEKLKEFILATRIELKYSKDKILSLYANHAPFGGNVVGLEAASWRYFNRSAHQLSWAESATLAVLPNAPSLIFPGKNQQLLLKKRNRLLKKLYQKKIIDQLTYDLAVAENLPGKPYKLPQLAPHLLQKLSLSSSGKYIKTTIDEELQTQINALVESHYKTLSQNEIYNIAVLVLDVKTRNVLAYIGNSPTTKSHQKDVDIIDKPRSTGSVLKPILYSALLDDGMILPNTIVPDIPTQYGNYEPQNYNKTYDGAVSAKQALARSLNVPSVRLLKSYGLERFHSVLKQIPLTNVTFDAQHYGLSLILGGAESNLWDLCKTYAAFAGAVNHYTQTSSEYFSNEFTEPNLFANYKVDFGKKQREKPLFNAASMYLTFESLKEVNRPQEDENWSFYDDSKQIAWKTGTSYGFKDAWAIGTTKDYVVGVWAGNADGEGRPGLVGVEAAAPLLFSVFDKLPKSEWFTAPLDDMVEVEVCAKSGSRASVNCEDVIQELIPQSGLKTEACKYHYQIHLDKNLQYRVNLNCEDNSQMVQRSWFQLPPLMAYYYKAKNPFYADMPPFREDCVSKNEQLFQFIYPKPNAIIYLPKDLDETVNDVIFKIAHNKPEETLYWYLKSKYLGETKTIHEKALQPEIGDYFLTVVDEAGNEISTKFTISK